VESLRALLLASVLGMAAGCEGMVPYHWDSAEKNGERTALRLEELGAGEAPAMNAIIPREGRRDCVQIDPRLFEIRIGKLVSRTAAASPRPPYSWGARTAADFYAASPRLLSPTAAGNGLMVEVRPGIRGFRIERKLEDELATEIEFSVEPREDAFRVTLERIRVKYCRAKVADCSWVNFWARIPCLYGFAFDIARVCGVEYGDNAVDMQIDLGVNSTWTDARGETHFAPIAFLGWTALDVPLGDTKEIGESSGWLPLPPLSVREADEGPPEFGRGHLALWALVTEQDELSQEFIAERQSVGEYMDEVLGILPIPTPGP